MVFSITDTNNSVKYKSLESFVSNIIYKLAESNLLHMVIVFQALLFNTNYSTLFRHLKVSSIAIQHLQF